MKKGDYNAIYSFRTIEIVHLFSSIAQTRDVGQKKLFMWKLFKMGQKHKGII